ncbi:MULTISPECIES: DegT/DnrJ/EryC1/StrS family aminotransferase [unclassified Streptomyces]|uniref:DegT/DnrJ/EryC1/StrS family aminotransferase n=1 Tax=unclassified Streptomyces TaxID=2593676 RepID=UPI0022B68474|nr:MULTISPECIES: DegT/DnrJ/EryC1/StrS family aminotransferase [unclassified Streptomyces]MCZ7414549.1 DegT/DnrJ/EryC1/StrS family aminotransferase [Streptomyces sp. WMMC897]MCZ7431476.1 DegT/DnrJ/EryC1/StrS family aminotransferase [Streptomyces sp. WMMC1477]
MVTTSTAARPTPVPFFDQRESFTALWPLIRQHTEEVFDRGKFSHGRKVQEFERALAEYTGARHAIAVNSGTDALVLLLRAAGIQPGDEVIVPAFSFFASASAVTMARATPVFADITADGDYGMDAASVEAAVTERTRAIMPVHLFSQLADMAALGAVAERHGLLVLEDSAEAIGMRWDGRHGGLLGTGGVLSFFPTKTLGALGDAGAVLTDDGTLAERAGTLRHHGRMGRTIDHIAGISNLSGESGTNSKMDDVQAAVLLAKLSRLDQDIARRRELADAYTERLRGTDGVLAVPRIVPRAAASDPVFYVYTIEVERRDGLAAHLTERGIGTETYYPRTIASQPAYAELPARPGGFPNAEAACRRTIALPLYPDMTEAHVESVCAAIADFYAGRQ